MTDDEIMSRKRVGSERDSSTDELIVGAFDAHIHCSPDTVSRILDFHGVAEEAVRAGMAGVAYKDVGQPTVDRAYAMKRLYPDLAVMGGIVLDLPAGGLNPFAVEHCLKVGGQIVWMPVVHSRHMVELSLLGTAKTLMPSAVSPDRAIRILTDSDDLVAPVKEIVALIREHDAILATGHLSPRESLALVRYARSHGVERVVVTHPCALSVGASLDMQRALAERGALLEHCYSSCTAGLDNIPVQAIADAVRTVGSQHCILSTDLGQTFNPPPVEGLREFLSALSSAGIPYPDLRRMVQENPARLFQ